MLPASELAGYSHRSLLDLTCQAERVRTAKPTLRITKWLRRVQTPRIPFEAECTACADAQFKIKYDKRREYGKYAFHQPRYDHYAEMLQREFEEHVKVVHPEEYPPVTRRKQS